MLFNLIWFDFYIYLIGLFIVILYFKRIFFYLNKMVESIDSERLKFFFDFVNEIFVVLLSKIVGIL